jgi:hypothetical protein
VMTLATTACAVGFREWRRPGKHLVGHRAERDAEVGHQRVAALQENVLRLDIAVDDAVLVGVLERIGGLGRDPDSVAQRELMLTLDAVAVRQSRGEPGDRIHGWPLLGQLGGG